MQKNYSQFIFCWKSDNYRASDNPKFLKKFKITITPQKMVESSWLCQAGKFFGWFWWGPFYKKIDSTNFRG